MQKEQISESVARIRSRYAKTVRRYPSEPCNKCKAEAWEPDYYEDVHSWYCLRCGNRGFWNYDGIFHQPKRPVES